MVFKILRCMLATLWVASASANNYDPLILQGNSTTAAGAKLLLFVPGGKVPIEDYVPLLRATMGAARRANFWAVVVHCGALNLCDPLGQLPGLIAKAIAAAGAARGAPFAASDTVVVGHSLGGVGARHYFDTQAAAPAASAASASTTPLGLAILGTQYNGDHEDFKGPLGFPRDLASFPRPFLGLLGELDMLPISHAALLWRAAQQVQQQAPQQQQQQQLKGARVLAGMDHSQFCAPFNVSGDIVPEISNEQATAAAAAALGAWLDLVVAAAPGATAAAARAVAAANRSRNRTAAAATADARDRGGGDEDDDTAAISAGYLAAQDMEQTAWCAQAQRLILARTLSPEQIESRLAISVTAVNSSAALEHLHTNYSLVDGAAGGGKVLHVQLAAYAYNAVNASSWNPVSEFAPTYASLRLALATSAFSVFCLIHSLLLYSWSLSLLYLLANHQVRLRVGDLLQAALRRPHRAAAQRERQVPGQGAPRQLRGGERRGGGRGAGAVGEDVARGTGARRGARAWVQLRGRRPHGGGPPVGLSLVAQVRRGQGGRRRRAGQGHVDGAVQLDHVQDLPRELLLQAALAGQGRRVAPDQGHQGALRVELRVTKRRFA
jgi:hypothetical protein